jgi:hypothetical protein
MQNLAEMTLTQGKESFAFNSSVPLDTIAQDFAEGKGSVAGFFLLPWHEHPNVTIPDGVVSDDKKTTVTKVPTADSTDNNMVFENKKGLQNLYWGETFINWFKNKMEKKLENTDNNQVFDNYSKLQNLYWGETFINWIRGHPKDTDPSKVDN